MVDKRNIQKTVHGLKHIWKYICACDHWSYREHITIGALNSQHLDDLKTYLQEINFNNQEPTMYYNIISTIELIQLLNGTYNEEYITEYLSKRDIRKTEVRCESENWWSTLKELIEK